MKRKFAVCAFIDKQGNVLLQDRTGISKYGEEWALFGGGIEGEETPQEAINREIREELGLTDVVFMLVGHNENSTQKGWVFRAKMPDLSKLVVYEGEGFRVCSYTQIQDLNITPAHKKLIKQALEHKKN